MKAVILAGGLGTRLSEETHLRPKPMVEIGSKPILWHIMKIFSSYGIKDFIICCGYKGYIIKEYLSTGVVFNKLDNSIDIYNGWRVANLSACSREFREFDFSNEDKHYVKNILSLKGVCIKIKDGSTAKYKQAGGTFNNLEVLQNTGMGGKTFKLLIQCL